MANENRKSIRSEDVLAGIRLRSARKLKRLSQASLGKELGVSVQQIQKYENARNRLSAGKIMKAAEVLEVSPSFFFAEFGDPVGNGADREMIALAELFSSGDAFELNIAFAKIENANLRKRIVDLVEEVAAVSWPNGLDPNH